MYLGSLLQGAKDIDIARLPVTGMHFQCSRGRGDRKWRTPRGEIPEERVRMGNRVMTKNGGGTFSRLFR